MKLRVEINVYAWSSTFISIGNSNIWNSRINIIHINQNLHDYITRRKGKILVINNCYLTSCDLQILKSLEREMSAARPHLIDPFAARATFDCAGAKIFFVFSIFDDHAVLCAVKSDKRKFKDKPFINRWSASQIKHITAKSNSKLRQKILFDIDYQSFAVVASLFVSRCRRSRWRFFCNEYLASTLSSHFWAV